MPQSSNQLSSTGDTLEHLRKALLGFECGFMPVGLMSPLFVWSKVLFCAQISYHDDAIVKIMKGSKVLPLEGKFSLVLVSAASLGTDEANSTLGFILHAPWKIFSLTQGSHRRPACNVAMPGPNPKRRKLPAVVIHRRPKAYQYLVDPELLPGTAKQC
jgi:hypothetical protein